MDDRNGQQGRGYNAHSSSSQMNQQYRAEAGYQSGTTGRGDIAGVFTVDHLATFMLPPGQSSLSPEMAVHKLFEMDSGKIPGGSGASGIFTMRVLLCIEPTYVVVIDAVSREEMERFPVVLIADPACVTPKHNDVKVKFDNIVLFTVLEDHAKGSPPEMHLFQCLGGPGQKIVDDIISSLAGKFAPVQPRVIAERQIAEPTYATALRPPRDANNDFGPTPEASALAALDYAVDPSPRQRFRQSTRYDPRAVRERPETANNASQTAERCIMLLDHCFNDLESFVTKLQQVAVAYKELDRRKTIRISKNIKQLGDGLLGMRSQPPPVKDFVDVFQKFKLSFILLAKLKHHIRDPNSPELVHFLFNPLSLVVAASRGGERSGMPDLPSRIVSPMLTRDARDLLDNCLTTKEMELWKSLGPAWTTSREDWVEDIPPYIVQFFDGWQPPTFWLEEFGITSTAVITGPTYSTRSMQSQGASSTTGPVYPTGPPVQYKAQPHAGSAYGGPDSTYDKFPPKAGPSYVAGFAPNRASPPPGSAYSTDSSSTYNRTQPQPPPIKQDFRGEESYARPPQPVSDYQLQDSRRIPVGSDSSDSRDSLDSDRNRAAIRQQQQQQLQQQQQFQQQQKQPLPYQQQQQQQRQQLDEKMDGRQNTRNYPQSGGTDAVPNGHSMPDRPSTPSNELDGQPPRVPEKHKVGKRQPQLPASAMAGRQPAAVAVSSFDKGPPDQFRSDLVAKNAKVFKVIQDREAANSKELTVQCDEIVEVIEDNRNWWKVQNNKGESGFVPKTLLEKY